ncbi:MAG TPA: pilus assembly protein TadB, partial [Actinopolymorphaceae bacterium]
MNGFSLPGLFLGLGVGFGLLFAISGLPIFKRPKLDDRLAPYVRDAAIAPVGDGGEHTFTPFPTLERILRPYLGRAARSLERMLGGGNAVHRRLRQAGLSMSVEEFRIEQLL